MVFGWGEDGDHNGAQGVIVWSERVEAGFVDQFCGGDAVSCSQMHSHDGRRGV